MNGLGTVRGRVGRCSKSLHGIVPKYVHTVGKKGAVSCGEGIP